MRGEGGRSRPGRARVRQRSHFVLDCCPKLCCCAAVPVHRGALSRGVARVGRGSAPAASSDAARRLGRPVRRRSGQARPIAPQRPVRPILRWGPGRTSLRPRPGRTIQRPAKPGSPDGRRTGVRGRTGQKSPDVPGQPGRGRGSRRIGGSGKAAGPHVFDYPGVRGFPRPLSSPPPPRPKPCLRGVPPGNGSSTVEKIPRSARDDRGPSTVFAYALSRGWVVHLPLASAAPAGKATKSAAANGSPASDEPVVGGP